MTPNYIPSIFPTFVNFLPKKKKLTKCDSDIHFTSTNNDHKHTWHMSSIYTSIDAGHRHKISVRRNLAIEANDHTHKLMIKGK